ncbi:hypothetical protein ALC57_06506 [Trachymyrmex cornetzi]|uniref:Uncharacterized protein n=1 Tax=Trachymyrmex cornetzi TaxID=471704 RepID=A0A151J8K1_9HYME|nr:hypothetical protein ALC57_06506 [Trachymyrmex cornetzi]
MSGNRTPAGRTAITTKISHLPGKFLTPPTASRFIAPGAIRTYVYLSYVRQPDTGAFDPLKKGGMKYQSPRFSLFKAKRIAYGMPEKRNFSCRITPRRKEEGGNVEEYNRKQDLQTRPEKRVRARLNFRRRHKLPSTARKQIIFFLLAHGGPPAAACSGGLEFPYSDPTEMRPGNSRRRIRDEKSVKTRYRESVEKRFKGKDIRHMLDEYCWSIVRDTKPELYKRQIKNVA